MEFVEFKKVYRLFRDVVVTEKIDGTNSGILIEEVSVPDEDFGAEPRISPYAFAIVEINDHVYQVGAQSRNRLLTPDSDNFGFANWVLENAGFLIMDLGVGVHFGEWWGSGIQRTYDQTDKFFSLFNTGRWGGVEFNTTNLRTVPVLYEGPFDQEVIRDIVYSLKLWGSQAAPGFKRPEGVITFHKPSNTMFKTTVEKDDASKYEMENTK